MSDVGPQQPSSVRSEEHTSELQSRPHISYAVFCLKKKNNNNKKIILQLIGEQYLFVNRELESTVDISMQIFRYLCLS